MLDTLFTLIVNATDWLFGWIQFLPRDLALFSVAVLTSAMLTLVRKWTTDQEWLHRAEADAARLAQLRREARGRGDKDTVRRCKETATLIQMKSMRFEGKPLLWALVPIALLGTWAFARLAFVPPRIGETVELRAYLPRSAIGQVAHLVPEPGVEPVNGLVQPVVADRPAAPGNAWDRANAWIMRQLGKPPVMEAVAVWRVKADDSRTHRLSLRVGGHTYVKEFFAGRRQYAAEVEVYPDAPVTSVELAMRPVRLFNYVGSIDLIFLPPWLVAYLLIAIPFVTVLRRVLRIA